MLRGEERDNLLGSAKQQFFIAAILANNFGIVIATPPCYTDSRAVFANALGPAPVRDAHHPRGFPDLSPKLKG